MSMFSDPVDVLKDPVVRSYLLGVLGSNLSSEQKYQEFVDCFKDDFELRSQITKRMRKRGSNIEEIDQVVSQVSQEMEIWNPQERLQQTEDSIMRAVRRLEQSKHSDGGWGFEWETSNFWGTAYAVLCLNAAKTLENLTFDVNIDSMLRRGLDWLKQHPDHWSVEYISPTGGMPVYEISLSIRCFYQAGGEHLEESSAAIRQSIKKLVGCQNDDGGWDALIWGKHVSTDTRVFSEVGATSAVLQALVEPKNQDHRQTVQDAIDWLIRNQNEDGSWNNGSCHPHSVGLSGVSAINKTCDGLQGILIGRDFGIDIEQFKKEHIDKAVGWLQSQEKPIKDGEGNISGWGWGDYEDTCLTLETLVRMPNALLPLLAENVRWFIETQNKEDGEAQDGNWQQGHTARIALSLIEYYKIIKKSAYSVSHNSRYESPR